MGRTAGDVQAARWRRLRLDHRGRARELQRDGAGGRWAARTADRAGASAADELSVSVALREGGARAAVEAGLNLRHDHDAVARGVDREGPERARNQRRDSQPLSAARPEIV